ncbi:MAG: helix-turn-helix domain-containing protein [Pyrinomonadaceae bacterium]|nr:helix-turn-helix domain-containing protein [Pyrinomonadaceae bacterium]
MDRSLADEELLAVAEVAAYLNLRPVTVYRWCREGRLPCIKLGTVWRIRRTALDAFLRQHERAQTLVSHLRAFLTIPDQVIGIAANAALLTRLDAAFFHVAEAYGSLMVKFVTGEVESVDVIRAALTAEGVDVATLEAAERLWFVEELAPSGGRVEALQRLLAAQPDAHQPLWASFDWARQVGLAEALAQHEALARLVDSAPLVVKIAVLEQTVDTWPPALQRQVQASHRGMIWLSTNRLSLTRTTPLA